MCKELHVISTGKQSAQTLALIMKQIHPYIDYIHVRERSWTAIELMLAIDALLNNGVPPSKIIINDRIDVAQAMKVSGVQLAYHSMLVQTVRQTFPKLMIGRSIHGIDEAKQAEQDGADRLMYGHIFPTSSKPNLKPRGLGNLQQIVHEVNIPVIAIGGMTPENVSSVLQTGAAGVAVLSGILLAEDPVTQVKRYRKQIDS